MFDFRKKILFCSYNLFPTNRLKQKLLTVKNAIFLCFFKNTDTNNICVSIVFKAKRKEKL